MQDIIKYLMAVCEDDKVIEEWAFDTETERGKVEASAYDVCSCDVQVSYVQDKDGNDIAVIYFIDYVIAI